jgi:Rrf2 family protein
MQIRRGTDFGVRAMCHLATLPPGRKATLDEFAHATEVPPSFLSKILQRLAAADLVRSTRGVTGGFEIARAPDRVSILDILTALEGPLAVNMCLMAADRCHRRPYCPAAGRSASSRVRRDL